MQSEPLYLYSMLIHHCHCWFSVVLRYPNTHACGFFSGLRIDINQYFAGNQVTVVPIKVTIRRLSKKALTAVFGAFGSKVKVLSCTKYGAELEFESHSGWSSGCIKINFLYIFSFQKPLIIFYIEG